MEPEKQSFFSTNFIRFLGGTNTLFTLIALVLIGLVIFIFREVSFIFNPLLVFMKTIVLPVILALVLYYLLRPVLRVLEGLKISRLWGIVIIFVGVTGLLTLLIVLVLPFLRAQTQTLIMEFPSYFMQLLTTTDAFLRNNRYIGEYYINSSFNIEELLTTLPDTINQTFEATAATVLTGITGFISTVTGVVLSIIIVPFILFYLLKDGEKLPETFIKALPPRFRHDTQIVLKEADKQIGAYIQGKLIVGAFIGVMVYIGFLIIGLDYALLFGFITGVTSVIPYIGPAIAFAPAAIVAIVISPFMLIKVGIVWTIVQILESNIISPQVMGKTMFIHPITIIFVLLTAGSLFGIVGVIFGIPAYALVKVLVAHLYKLFKRRYNKHEANLENHYDYTELL
ncbi:putative PurR-regulated permease PerM [Planomicrobium soli]|uniref:Putative PurR-regulated permease PerM n=1 Tax=Planomicrobium soli TaxID=1176648 RepID=A0A2P8H6J8_9BACL|nr:AI-2E family transporter [Planomicrobium soli]PSL41865.1 putative PurR-regulated permease PerM [Planomicrobium soli]